MRKNIDTVITDLDDTIWDWLGMWYASFSPFINSISKHLDIPLEELKSAFSELHTRYHTTESSFLIEELNILDNNQIRLIKEEPLEDGKSIMHNYNSNKKKNTCLYEGVLGTLQYLQKSGTRVIGFTESKSFYTSYRVIQTRIDGLMDTVYTPADHDLPEDFKRFYPENYWILKKTDMKLLHGEFKKPSPEILLEIIDKERLNKDRIVYIGDKLQRDILMANKAGVTSVQAKYGHVIKGEAYELLKEVTHWTPQEVEDEIQFHNSVKGLKIDPNHTLEESYNQILNLFKFERYSNRI